ncbi:MAG: hypothetical protein NDJ92_04290 [Thermoanaerobaculia bacterium]|nr:hypothetical protein [Thermoanaerobaculia bacterium]
MFRLIPVVLAALALTGCMKSYPLWDPPPPQSAEETMPASVTLEGRVASIDEDDESIELELAGEDSDEWLRVEFGSATTVFPEGARDRAVSGTEGLEMLAEDDKVVVTGLKTDDDVIRAREVSIGARGAAPKAAAMPAPQVFQPRDRVNGVVRAIDTQAGRIVLDTDGYGVIAFYGDADTPVFYKGVIYKIPNLEVGDRVTMTIGSTDEGDPATPWITAIDVSRSVTHDGAPPRPATAPLPEPVRRDVGLEVSEVDGTMKRVEAQGFEIELEGGALRYVTADPLMPVLGTGVESAKDLRAGMMVRVRYLEVGNRLVAQKISLLK